MSMAASSVTFVSTEAETKEFIEFLYTHYMTDGFFVPPLRQEQHKLINKQENPFFKQARMAMFLAHHDGKIAGRIAAVVDDRFNHQHGLNTGHFAFFECIDYQPTADLLFRVAEDWLRGQGVEEVLGPTNPGMMDVLGFLVDGFDKYPYIMMPYSKPYYEKLALSAGYEGVRDLLAFVLDESNVDFDRMRKAKSMIMRRYPQIHIRPVSLKNIDEEVKIVRDIYNEAWKNNWGFLPLSLEEIKGLAKEFKMIYDTHFDNLRQYLNYRSGDQQLSDDIAQSVFMKVWTKKIEVASGNLKSLLFKMATDEFVSHVRRQKVERSYRESINLRVIHESEPENDGYGDKKVIFEKALGQLPEKQRTALLMNKMQGLTYKEIAESLNLSQKAVEKRISQALNTLKQNLNQQ